jgi:hypothetical protein
MLAQVPHPGYDGLQQRGHSHGILGARADVGHAEFQRGEGVMGPHIPPDLRAIGDAAGVDQPLHEAVEGRPGGEGLGQAGAGQVLEDDGAVGLQAGVAAGPEGRAGGQGQNVGQGVAHGVHAVDGEVAVLDPHVDVHAEDQHALGDDLMILHRLGVALVGGDLLAKPVREGMGGGRGDLQAALGGQIVDGRSLSKKRGFQLGHVVADRRAQLDHGGVQLRLDAGLELALLDLDGALFRLHELGDERFQLARLRVDDLVFFFDADGEGGRCHHGWFSLPPPKLPTFRKSWQLWGKRASYRQIIVSATTESTTARRASSLLALPPCCKKMRRWRSALVPRSITV